MEDKRLELLLNYTIFHIGVYLSLTTALMGARVLGRVNHWTIRWAIFWFLVAGACGGLVAANIAEESPPADDFLHDKYRLWFWCFRVTPLRWVTTIEHLAFWVAILPIAYAFVRHADFKAPK